VALSSEGEGGEASQVREIGFEGGGVEGGEG